MSPVLAVDTLPEEPEARGALRGPVEDALREASRTGDDRARARATTSLGALWFAAGDYARAGAAWRGALPLLRTGGDAEAELAALLGLARLSVLEADVPGAAAFLDRARPVADASGLALPRARVRLAHADLAERCGRFTDALREAEAMLVGFPEWVAPTVIRLCLRLGEPMRARPVLDFTRDPVLAALVAVQAGERPEVVPPEVAPWVAALDGRWDDVAGPDVLLAWKAVAYGDADGALAGFDAQRVALLWRGFPFDAALCGVFSAGCLADAGRPKAAEGLLAEVEVLLSEADPVAVGAPFDLARARLARAHGDETSAVALAAQARSRCPTPPLAVRVDLATFSRTRRRAAAAPI